MDVRMKIRLCYGKIIDLKINNVRQIVIKDIRVELEKSFQLYSVFTKLEMSF